MRIALLLRGFHYLPRDRFGFPLDGRQLLPSFRAKIIEPLRTRHEVDLFAVTYPSPVGDSLLADLDAKSTLLLDSRTSSQIETFANALDLIRGAGPYDRIISTRFDLLYLRSIESWPIWDRRGAFLVWREYEEYWHTQQRVGDAIHVIDWPVLDAFQTAVLAQRPRADMHFLYGALAAAGVTPSFIEEGFYDSNTLFCNPECSNPLYRIGNRPRLPFPNPYGPPHPSGRKRMMMIYLLNRLISATAAIVRTGLNLLG